jgi:sulfur carrier protein ThiS
MEVKVIRVPGRTTTVELPEGSSVAEALNRADITLSSGESCKLNGNEATLGDILSEGDRVIVAKGAKGNS